MTSVALVLRLFKEPGASSVEHLSSILLRVLWREIER